MYRPEREEIPHHAAEGWQAPHSLLDAVSEILQHGYPAVLVYSRPSDNDEATMETRIAATHIPYMLHGASAILNAALTAKVDPRDEEDDDGD